MYRAGAEPCMESHNRVWADVRFSTKVVLEHHDGASPCCQLDCELARIGNIGELTWDGLLELGIIACST